MKDLTLQIDIKIYDYNELSDADRQLMDAAREATQRSYAPYSHFSVGAAARLAMVQLSQVPIKKTQLIHRDFVPNVLPCFMQTPNIPIRQ